MPAELSKAQKRLLDMAKTIGDILDRHDIPHSIIYGTLLGAVRHKGFIPWDDDFDFAVFDEVYEDAIKCLRAELPSDMFVEDEETEPLYFHAWAHVKDLNTEAYSKAYVHDNVYAHHGLSIDLYRMRKIKYADMFEEAQKQMIAYIDRRYSKGLMSEEEYNRRITRDVESRKSWYERIIPLEAGNDPERYIYSNIYTSLYRHEIEDFFPLKKYAFENTEFWGPDKGEKMLAHWYGDYMALPPEEKRRSHYDEVKFL